MIYELIVMDEYMERVVERGPETAIVTFWHNYKQEILSPALQSDRPEESATAEMWLKKRSKDHGRHPALELAMVWLEDPRK